MKSIRISWFAVLVVLLLFIMLLSAPIKAAEEISARYVSSVKSILGEAKPITPKGEFLQPIMVLIPSGTFLMGKRKSISNGHPSFIPKSQKPLHKVTLRSFFIGKYEITFAQWDNCVQDGGCKKRPSDQGFGRGNKPVINVSWHDANTYANWLSRKTGKVWRLPTDAEWEYAARAGTSTRYSFGDSLSSTQANFDGRYPWGDGKKSIYRKKTADVGQFPANAFGLHDMHGNVWEWTHDWFSETYYQSSPSHNPKGPATGTRHVMRGGCWDNTGSWLYSANRHNSKPSYQGHCLGFRLVREVSR